MIDINKILSEGQRIDAPKREAKDRYFVPFFKVTSGRDFFAPKEHKVSDLPAEIYERLHSKI